MVVYVYMHVQEGFLLQLLCYSGKENNKGVCMFLTSFISLWSSMM